MISKRFYAILFTILLIGIIFLPVVYAQEDRIVRRYVELLPDADWDYEENNLAKVDETLLEKDFLETDFPLPIGKFYGAYLKSSLLRLHKDGATVSFSSSFIFPSSVIMNGVSDFWVRVPFYPLNTDEILFKIFNSTKELYKLPLTEKDDRFSEVLWKDSGFYLRIRSLYIFPDIPYTFYIKFKVKEGERPQLFLTEEKYQVKDYTEFHIFRTAFSGKYIYNFKENLTIYPAWDFIFLSGIGHFGHLSYDLKFDSSYDFLDCRANAEGDASSYEHRYFSFYLPFMSNKTVNWKIEADAFGTIIPNEPDPPIIQGWVWQNPSNPDEYVEKLVFWVNDTADYLLVSTPWYLHNPNPGGPPSLRLLLYPSCDIITLGRLRYRNESLPYWAHDDDLVDYWHDVGWEDEEYIDHLPIYWSWSFTDGRWAKVTPKQYFITYDFGWSTAYYFPGETQLYVFLDNGTSYFWKGNVSEISKEIEYYTGPDWLLDILLDAPGNIYGLIMSPFTAIINFILMIGEWIWNALITFIDWIISLAKNLWDKASIFMYAILAGLPMIIILFIGSKAGAYIFLGDVDLGAEKATISETKMKIRKIIKKRKAKPVKKIKRIEKKTERYKRKAERYTKQAERIRAKYRGKV